MMKAVLVLATAAFLAGCASPAVDDPSASRPPQPMPDGRELTEHPLDVLSLPQP